MSNCLIFAFFQWLRFGGYVIVRKSHYGWWPHFMWAKDLNGIEILEFSPDKKVQGIFPPVVFRGKVRSVKVGEGGN